MKKNSDSGFTLIELLIVIAIILILIAIALPNFLEAQMRAKVVKSRGNMRSIETAMLSLSIDMGSVHPDFNDIGSDRAEVRELVHRIRARGRCSNPTRVCGCTCTSWTAALGSAVGFVVSGRDYYCPGIHCPLTSPINYMTEAETIDPFGGGLLPHGYDSYPGGTGNFIMSYGALFGIGPDMIAGNWRRGRDDSVDVNGDGTTDALPYNPTNGTKSKGEMWRVVAFDTNIAKAHYPMLTW
jgi:prepilin-type N-terminal cleavage/methylation domain-containing protein